VLASLLVMALLAEFLVRVSDHRQQGVSLVQADVFAPVVLAGTVLLSCWLVVLERRRSFITSGVLFIFWVLLAVTQAVPFYTLILLKEYDNSILKFSLFYIQYTCFLMQIVVHCFAEKPLRPYQPVKAPCPETEASFLSRLTFWWANRLLLQGYSTPLTEEVMTDLHPRDKSSTVVPEFLRNWSKELSTARTERQLSSHKRGRRSSFYAINGPALDNLDETTPLVVSIRGAESNAKRSGRPQASLLKVLCKTFGVKLLLAQLWKLFYDVLLLSNPLILGQLISFTENPTNPQWNGFVLSLALFLSLQLQSFLFHQTWHYSTSVSLRLRASLISAIFRKALTMNTQARRESPVGEVVNLMSVDTEHIQGMIRYLWTLWSSPLQICVSLYLLFNLLGAAMVAGLAVLILLIPVNGLVMSKLGALMEKLMLHKDKRLKLINEVLNGMKILKLYAWEPSFSKMISEVRDEEMNVSLVTFFTYIYTVDDHYLSPHTAFVAISLLNILRFAINFAPMILTDIIKAVISARRINRFLSHDDLAPDIISRTSDSSSGQVGSGKSSLVSALIGDMEKVSGELKVKADLDILPAGDLTEIGERGINLSGGQKQRVSLARALYSDADVYLLDSPLSAVDSHVGKYIFEEVISRDGLLKRKTRILVTHGVHWLPMVDQVIVMSAGKVSEVGTFEELLSHNGVFAHFLKTHFLVEAADEKVDDPEGEDRNRIFDMLSPSTSTVVSGATKEKEEKKEIPDVVEDKLIEEEKVRWDVFKMYAHSAGYGFTLLVIIVYILYEAGAVLANIWLSLWTDDPDLNNLTAFPANSSERLDRNNYYLGMYGAFGAAQTICVLIYSVVDSVRTVHASKHLHKKMLHRVVRAPMAFFDTTPVGRIVNRFSQDISTIDTELPLTFIMGLDSLCIVVSTLVVISYSTPIFMVAILPLFAVYLTVQRFYIPTSRQLKRLESKTRSPIYNYFSETISGASVIRAYGRQSSFIEESERRVDLNQMFGFASYSANRWLGFRLEFVGNLVILLASTVAVALRDSISGGIIGLSVSYALEITTNLSWLVRMISDLETQVVSVERVKEYTEIAHEAPWQNHHHRPPPNWPQYGLVRADNLSLRYRPGLDLVLKDVSFLIQGGEKVGIVGRTGAGKSSLTLAMFRLIEPAGGQIYVDNMNIADLGLHDLRTRITILPQDPVIFAGTLRVNLDPFEEYSDDQLWMALQHAHLREFVETLPEKLEYECGEGGENLSVGQRQLLCLARSLLRKTKILILDEATAAVDVETDNLIQRTIRTEFADSTVLTIAHRLNTVMDYDRILVLDKGRTVEFDSPANLLKNSDGIFFQMAKSAGLA
ncbi:hypothetical protein BaRGS_00022157, partial [Batillaria attramentaria]